ncbi:MAG: thiolase family protein [Conexivisphaerales archaeon]
MITGYAGIIQKTYQGSAFELLSYVVNECIEKAGKDYQDIDGLCLTYLPGIFDGKTHLHFFAEQVKQYLGIKSRLVDVVHFGGASALTMIQRAEKAVHSGDAENVLCIIGGLSSTLRGKGVTADSLDKTDQNISLTPFDRFFRIYEDMNPVSDYALVAMRHSKVFGTTDEQRAILSVKQRKNASNNPKAMYREQISVKDVLLSPLICDPLHLLEIVYPVDGFHAFLVSRTSSSSSLRSLEPLAYGEAHWHDLPSEMPDILTTPAAESSRMADFPLSRVDCFELYDSFTITVMLQMEDIGLVEKGRSGKFVDATDISPSGDSPMNTGGGSLNTGQPAFMSGGVILMEALDQLNGVAEGHQVKDARVVYLNGIGGWSRSNSVTLVLGEKK